MYGVVVVWNGHCTVWWCHRSGYTRIIMGYKQVYWYYLYAYFIRRGSHVVADSALGSQRCSSFTCAFLVSFQAVGIHTRKHFPGESAYPQQQRLLDCENLKPDRYTVRQSRPSRLSRTGTARLLDTSDGTAMNRPPYLSLFSWLLGQGSVDKSCLVSKARGLRDSFQVIY